MPSSNDSDEIIPKVGEATLRVLEQQTERFESMADNAMSTFRINLLIMGIFIPVVALISRSGADIEPILLDRLTQFGILLWIISSGTSMWSYFFCRQMALAQTKPYTEYFTDRSYDKLKDRIEKRLSEGREQAKEASQYVTVGVFTAVISTYLLAGGIVRSYIEITTTGVLFSLTILSISGMWIANFLSASARVPGIIQGGINFVRGRVSEIQEIIQENREKYLRSEGEDDG